MAEEVGDLVRPILAERVESLIEQLRDDEALWKDVRDRFDQGRLRGNHPALSEVLSKTEDEDKEALLRSLGTEAMRSFAPPKVKPWDESPFNGRMGSYREELYSGMAYSYFEELPDFAKEWLEELTRVGYRGMGTILHEDGIYRVPMKQQADDESAVSMPLGPRQEAYPVLFESSRQVLWLQLGGDRSVEHGYKEVRVSDEPLRTDKAILAALTALEGDVVDTARLHAALRKLKLPLEVPMFLQWDEALKDLPAVPYKGPGKSEEHHNQVRKQLEESDIPGGLQSRRLLDYVLLLLRYHRPRFDDLPQEEKLALIERTCAHINEFLMALRKLVAFLEYGQPGKQRKAATRNADRDVQAAVLRDVLGLTYLQIGKKLDVLPPEDFHHKGDHPRVRQMVNRGRDYLERALGKEGWQKHIEVMRAEAERWNSLSDVEQSAEERAHDLGMPYEEALRIEEGVAARRPKKRRS